VDAAVPRRLVGDDMRLQQVLINLGGNAIKFTSEGEVVLAVRVVEQTGQDVVLEFALRDSGIGIAPEKQEHIFSGFSQAESNTTRRFGGTGLGLSISRRLVELMGGELKLDSTPGKGSTFHFQVRFALTQTPQSAVAEEVSKKRPADRKVPRLAGMRLLVVEDNRINQLVAQGLLSQEGADVTLAENGALGVAAVASARPAFDAVLMDVQMPVMDGYTATRAIRAELGLTDLPVIAMTANAMASDREACLASGMDDHVGKPFELDHLVALLLQHTGRSKAPCDIVPIHATPHAAPLESQPVVTAELDIEAALHRLGGNAALLATLLHGFAHDVVLQPLLLRDHLEASRQEDAIRALHTLKGLAATVGANHLAQVVRQLEIDIQRGNAAREQEHLVQQLQSAVEATVLALQPVLRQYALPPTQAGSGDSSIPPTRDLLELLRLLEDSNMRALDVFARLQQHYGNAWLPAVEPMGNAIANLDFTLAASHCKTLLEQMPE
jgi:CheY-like chemotaxis protein